MFLEKVAKSIEEEVGDIIEKYMAAITGNAPGQMDRPAPVIIEKPDAVMGDLAVPCFQFARSLRKAPAAIAGDLLEELTKRKIEGIRLIEQKGPYLNFRLDNELLMHETLGDVFSAGNRFGNLPSRDISILLEHTSANPNGPFHVGRARNPILGDTLARILRAAGYDVTTEYYVNDMGKQAIVLAWGVNNLTEDELPPAGRDTGSGREKIDHRLVRYYRKANEIMKERPGVVDEIDNIVTAYEQGDETVETMVREPAEKVLCGMKESLARIHIDIDSFTWESKFVKNRAVDRVIEKLTRTEVAERAGSGAWALELVGFGVKGRNTKFVFARSSGTSLYTTRDLAYHLDKFSRCDIALNILGEDHKLQAQQLGIALGLLGVKDVADRLFPNFYSFVSLPEGKMSTRIGRVVYLDDLIDEAVARAYEEVRERREGELSEDRMHAIAEVVGIGALRFNILRVQAEKGIRFRWEEALNFEGASAPFVQYAYTRASSILGKAGVDEKTLMDNPKTDEWSKDLTHPSEIAFIKQIARLPGTIEQCAAQRRVHGMAAYAVELAALFNQFYRDCPVLHEKGKRDARLALTLVARIVIKKALDLLGIDVLEEM